MKCHSGNGVEIKQSATRKNVAVPRGSVNGATFVNLSEVSSDKYDRLNTGLTEFNRVLGGGLVPGSYLALSGEPGAGKTTLSSQIMISMIKLGHDVAYVSAEESEAQAKMRFERLGVDLSKYQIPVSTEKSVERVIEAIANQPRDLVVIDSIQTMFSEGLTGTPGSISQVRECGGKLQQIAKETGTSILLIAQITKSGEMAGPKEFEHAVDVVLGFEGDRREQYRILRADKNRFGSTEEIAVFEMTGSGLKEIEDPSELFVGDHAEPLPGVVVCPVLEGSRVLMCEIQALVRPSNAPMPVRAARGLDPKRVQMLLAVLSQQVGFAAGAHEVFLNVSGGLKIDEPAIDLAVCVAIMSAHSNRPVLPLLCAFGEVTLPGEVRPAAQFDRRTAEAKRLGYKPLEPGQRLRQTIEDALDTQAVHVGIENGSS